MRHQSSDWKASAPAAGSSAGSSSCRTGDRSICSRSSLLEGSITRYVSLDLPPILGVSRLRSKQTPYQGCIKKPIIATDNLYTALGKAERQVASAHFASHVRW